MDGAVDMGFGGKIDDGARPVLGQQPGDQVESPMSPWTKHVARIAVQRCQVLQIAGVGELVEVDDRLVGLRQPVEDEIAADEAGAAGDQNHKFIT